MNEKRVEDSLPATGAFPGYKFGRSLFLTWMNAMEEQANIWNAGWSKLVSGDYELKDFYQALGKSVEASAASLEHLRVRLTSSASPPWVSLSWPPGGAITVRLSRAVDSNHKLSLKLFRLGDPGGASGKRRSARPAAPVVVEASAQVSGTYAASVTLKPGQPAPGEYVGFLVSDQSSEPLAIATLIVSR